MSQTSVEIIPKAGEISWNQLLATNSGAAAAFYSKLFGWQPASFVPPGMPAGTVPFTLFKTDPQMMGGVAGMVQSQHPENPAQWIPYVVVDDLEAAVDKAVKLGATARVQAKSIGELGRIAVIQDPQGATIGLHEFMK
jgi:uncharacterized protein